MADRSSAASEASTSALSERESASSSSARPTPTDDGSSPDIGQESPALRTFVKLRRAGEDDPSPESWAESDTAVDAAGHGPRTATLALSIAGNGHAVGDNETPPLKASEAYGGQLISSPEDSPARISPSPAPEEGLIDGERSSLFFEFGRVADALLADGGWVLIENVPGLLSSNRGRDFAVLLATLAELGFHDLAWRVLDSRYLGVPQRRRRVFILARRARGRRAAEVLLEPESGGGDFEAGREARSRVAAPLTRGSSTPGVSEPGRRQEDDVNIVNALDRKGGGADDNEAQAGHLIARPLLADGQRGDLETETFISAPTQPDGVRAPSGLPGRVDVGFVSCAFDPKPDAPRYAACGDAVTVSVAEWIGRRLMEHVHQHQQKAAA